MNALCRPCLAAFVETQRYTEFLRSAVQKDRIEHGCGTMMYFQRVAPQANPTGAPEKSLRQVSEDFLSGSDMPW